MIDRMIDSMDDFATRYRRPISILAAGWFLLSWLSNARFLDLPEIPLLTGKTAIFASAAFNGLWWGWLNPRIERRRTERVEAESKGSEVANG